MQSDRAPIQQLRALPARRPSLLCLLAFVVLLKAAVPLLAALSAYERDVSLAEVCSVYGVRTFALGPGSDNNTSEPTPAEHAGSEHCTLMPLLGAAALASPPEAAVLLHAPAEARAEPRTEPLARPDASFAWLAARTHAPPSSA